MAANEKSSIGEIWRARLWLFEVLGWVTGVGTILFGVVSWHLEADDRVKERHYRAWELINSARGSTGDGGRRDALRDLNEDRVNLSAAPLANAYLFEVQLSNARLPKANLTGANLVRANLSGADLTGADLQGADLYRADLTRADLEEANLNGASLYLTNLIEAVLKKITADFE